MKSDKLRYTTDRFIELDIFFSGTKCGRPAVPMNTKLSLSDDSLKAGTVASYTCDAGYELFG